MVGCYGVWVGCEGQLSAGNGVLPVLVACGMDPTEHAVTVHVMDFMCLSAHRVETLISTVLAFNDLEIQLKSHVRSCR